MATTNHLIKFLTAFALMFFLVANCEGIYGKSQNHLEEASMKSLTVNMIVTSMDETIRYYVEVLGFGIVMSVPEEEPFNWAMLKNGDVSIMLQSRESMVADHPEFKNPGGGGDAIYFIQVEGLQKLFDMVQAKGAHIVKTPYDTFYGTREFVIRDCNDFILVFAEDIPQE